jgi:hypothetical protein
MKSSPYGFAVRAFFRPKLNIFTCVNIQWFESPFKRRVLNPRSTPSLHLAALRSSSVSLAGWSVETYKGQELPQDLPQKSK